jgi:hypothetical protein
MRKKNEKKGKKAAVSTTKKALAKHFENSLPAVRSLLGLETEKGIDELFDHYTPTLEKIGEAASGKAISDAIGTIKTGALETVLKIMELRKSSPMRAIRRKVVSTAPAEQSNTNNRGEGDVNEA